MAIGIGERLTATIYIFDGVGAPLLGLAPTLIDATDPLGGGFAVTITETGGGGYFVQSVEPATMEGTYTALISANDGVDLPSSQKFTAQWDTDAPAAVVTGIQRVQYVMVPHPADPDGTHDSRYFTKSEGADAIEGLIDGKADLTYVDAQLALKADQTEVTQLATDVGNITADLDDMATQTWVSTQLGGYSVSSHNHDSRYYTETEMDTLLGAKVNDFTQWYTQVVVLGDGINAIQTTEPAVIFSVPEDMTLHSVELWGDVSGSITLGTSKAGSGTLTWTTIHASAPLALSGIQGPSTPALAGWTTAFSQFDKLRTVVSVNAISIKKLWVVYRFSKGRS